MLGTISIPILSEEPITGAIVIEETSGAAVGPEPVVVIDQDALTAHGIEADAHGWPTLDSLAEWHARVNGIG